MRISSLLFIVLLSAGVLCQNNLFGDFTYQEDDFEHESLGLLKELEELQAKMVQKPAPEVDDEDFINANLHNNARALHSHIKPVKRYDVNGLRRNKYDVDIRIVDEDKLPKPKSLVSMNKDGSMSSAFLAAQDTRAKLKAFLKQTELEPQLKIVDEDGQKKHHAADLSNVAVPADYAGHLLKIDPLPVEERKQLTDPLDLEDTETFKDQHGNKIQIIPGTQTHPIHPKKEESHKIEDLMPPEFKIEIERIIAEKDKKENEQKEKKPENPILKIVEANEEDEADTKEEKKSETNKKTEETKKTETKTETEESEESEEEKEEKKDTTNTETKTDDTTETNDDSEKADENNTETDTDGKTETETETKKEEKKTEETKKSETKTEEADPEPTD